MSAVTFEIQLRHLVHREIAAAGGVIPFARFMELALYTPDLGYYEREAGRVGPGGDFQTSVGIGSLLGHLLADHFAASVAKTSGLWVLVEAGAHAGALAHDLLTALREWHPALTVEYWLIEPSVNRQRWQAARLAEFADQVHWAVSWTELDRHFPEGIAGMIFANELLDAFPVHRLVWEADTYRWMACGVASVSDRFTWRRMSLEAAGINPLDLPNVPPELAEVLPNGFTTEVGSLATKWWARAARTLRRGRILTLDYGLDAEEFLMPHRAKGTLRGYYRHHFADDLLANPGQQDLTAHVNFTALRKAGEAAGLGTHFEGSQRNWLTQVMVRTLTEQGSGFRTWNGSQVRQFQTLTHPEHFGRAFRVLEQGR